MAELVPFGAAALRELLPEWRGLWAGARDREPFSHPDWVAAYLAAFEPAATPVVLTARLDGALIAVVPLIRESTILDGMPVRLLRALMNPHTFRVHLLTADGALQAPCAICDYLTSMPGWDVLAIPRFARDGFPDHLGHCTSCHGFPTMVLAQFATRYMLMPDAASARGDEPWLTDVRPELKKKLRKGWRQVLEEYRIEPALETHDAADPAQLARFYDIEASGWKGREGTAIKCAPDTLQFYNAVAQAFAAEGALRLHFLGVGNVTIAGAFSLVAGDQMFVLKWSYDETYSKYRPGNLLAREMLRDASQHGIRTVDLGSDADYKREWTSRTREHESLYVFNNTMYGKLLYAYRARLRPYVGELIRSARKRPA